MALLKAYEITLEKDRHELSYAWVAFFSTLAILLRQEALLPIIALLLYVGLVTKNYRSHLCTGLLVFPVLIWSFQFFVKKNEQIQYDYYEATLLINPLSNILSEKYPEGLPASVDASLGTFFKNDFLIKYYSPLDIEPYHKGGASQRPASHEEYLKFREAAFAIFLQNPDILLKNRVRLSMSLLGLDFTNNMYIEDQYYRLEYTTEKMINTLPYQTYERQAWFESMLRRWEAFVSFKPKLYYQSYLIPLLMWLTMLLIYRSRILVALSLVLFFRAGIVFVTAPAAYYKYQLPIWIFVPFVLVYVIAEKRSVQLSKK